MSQRYIGGLIYNPPGGFSGYFDGSGDYLSLAANTAFDLGSGDFTIEAWVNFNSFASSNGNVLISKGASGSVGGDFYSIQANGSGAIQFYFTSGLPLLSGPTLATGVWYHIAVTRSGTSFTMWVNGNSSATATSSATLSSGGPCIVGSQSFSPGASDRSLYGYLSNARIVKGTAVYTTAFTPPVGQLQAITNTSLLTCAYPTFRDGSSNNFTITVNGNTAVSTQNPFPQTQLPNPALGNQGNGVYSMSQYQALRSQNLWPAIDPYFDYVTLMLHGNGTNGAQNNTFLDSSTNNFTITRNGNTTQGTFTPYGSNWGNYFNGSNSQLTAAANNAFVFGTGDFCIEGFFFVTADSTSNVATIVANTAGGNNGWIFSYYTGGFRFQATAILIFQITSSLNAWHHVVICRASGVTSIFVDGVRQGTTSTVYTWSDNATLGIGYRGTDNYFTGYMSSLRLVKGASVYDPNATNITVPTDPLTAITNTSLLTCQSNRFIDNSTNAFSLTVNGSPSVQRFSPFAPTTPYAAGTIGGSGYFDGSGDYIQAGTNANLALGSGNFTIEGWHYCTGYNGGGGLYSTINTYPSSTGLLFYIDSIGRYTIDVNGTILQPAGTAVLNAWIHWAVVRNGSTLSIYINGTSIGSVSSSTNFTDQYAVIGRTGAGTNSNLFLGYLSNTRMVKGTAVYTANFTPPTVPVTAIANTQFLCDFTNGGIIDNAMMNDLETVGNAQISTSVSKFGGGSMSFNGTNSYMLARPNDTNSFGTGDFTLEAWVYPSAFTSPNSTIACVWASTGYAWYFGLNGSTNVLFGYAGSTVSFAYTFSANNWYHIAITRSSGSVRAFVNGTQVGSTQTITSSLTANSTVLAIGANMDGGPTQYWNGYIDDLRITKGYARYTANFTPQRSQWQDQ